MNWRYMARPETVGALTLATAPMAAAIAKSSFVSYLAVTHLRPKGQDRINEMCDEIGTIYHVRPPIGEDF